MARTHTQDWYDHPRWYDILHAPGTASEVRGLVRLARRFNPEAAPRVAAGSKARRAPVWLEPACGSGRYLIGAARRGIRGMGLDINPKMIAYASERAASGPGPRPRFRAGDMTRFALSTRDRGDFAFCLINSVRHLETDRAMLDHFECMARALRPGGVYAVGLSLIEYASERASEDVWVGSRGRTRVHQLVSFLPPTPPGRRERVISHLTITTPRDGPDVEHHLDSVYHLRTYDGRQWARLLGRSAMECVGIVDESGDDLPGTCSDGRRLLEAGRWWSSGASGYAIFVLAPR